MLRSSPTSSRLWLHSPVKGAKKKDRGVSGPLFIYTSLVLPSHRLAISSRIPLFVGNLDRHTVTATIW